MAEGISTSPQTCPPHSQDLYELSAPKGSASPFTSHLHVNDLGLTPSPGSQQEQKQSMTHVSCQDDGRGCSSTGVAVANQPSAKSPEEHARDLHTEIDFEPYDPLFDEDVTFKNLESTFPSQKRVHDEAFPESEVLEGLPEKRQAQDISNSVNTPLDETPSLSPNSTYRTDQAETAINTPAGIEDLQAPDLFFGSLDHLFQNSEFPMSFEGGQFPTDFLSTGLDDSQLRLDHDTSNASEPTRKTTTVAQPEPALPLVSDETNKRFSLGAQDIAANSSREILQRTDNVPQYMSPYPEYGGPLGYIPSTPGLHSKCIEVTEERMNRRMESLRQKNQQLTSERNKYKHFWAFFSIADADTGKTKQDMIQDENSMLRRVSTRHQTRAEEYKKEAEHWKGSLNEVSALYNNLLYEINVLRKVPEVAPPPNGYKPPSTLHIAGQHQPPTVAAHPHPQQQQPVFPGRSVPYQQPTTTHIQTPLPSGAASQYSSSTAVPQSQPPHGSSCLSNSTPAPTPTSAGGSGLCAVTIDLTEDDDVSTPQPPKPLVSESSKAEALESLRRKRYHWLGDNSSSSQATSETCSSTAPRTLTTAHPQSTHNDADNDELARLMEEELARGF